MTPPILSLVGTHPFTPRPTGRLNTPSNNQSPHRISEA